MSVSAPSYFMFNLRMDERYKQVIWETLSETERSTADTEWKALYSANKGAYGGTGGTTATGATTISSSAPTARFNTDPKQLYVTRDATYSTAPTTATLSGFGSLIKEDGVSGLIFVDVRNANTDTTLSSRASAAYDVMTGRFAGAQGVLGVDLNDNGAIDDISELFGSRDGTQNGYLDLVIDPAKLTSGDRIGFAVPGVREGKTQTFTVTDETSVDQILASLTAALSSGELAGVTAGKVNDGRIRLTAADVDRTGTVTGSLADASGDLRGFRPANGAGATADTIDFLLDPSKLSEGDELRLGINGEEKVFRLGAGQATLAGIVDAINNGGAIAGVTASDQGGGVLRLSAAAPDSGTNRGIEYGSFANRTTAFSAVAGDGASTYDTLGFVIDPSRLSSGDKLSWSYGGAAQEFTVTDQTTVQQLADAIAALGSPDYDVARVSDTELRLTARALNAGDGVSLLGEGTWTNETATATTAGTAVLSQGGMQRISDYVDASGNWISGKQAMLLSTAGTSMATNQSLSGLVNGEQTTITSTLSLAANQPARVNVTV
jgi:hypothetical protein